MIFYNTNNLASRLQEIEEIGTILGIEISDDEVWEQARNYANIPVFENIYQSILFNRIQEEISSNFGFDIEVFINASDSHLSIDFDGGYEPFTIEILNDILYQKAS